MTTDVIEGVAATNSVEYAGLHDLITGSLVVMKK
jgi:hypothetical protein